MPKAPKARATRTPQDEMVPLSTRSAAGGQYRHGGRHSKALSHQIRREEGSRLFAYRHPEAFATLIELYLPPAVRLTLRGRERFGPVANIQRHGTPAVARHHQSGDDCGDRALEKLVQPLGFSEARTHYILLAIATRMEHRDESNEETSLQRQQIPR
jgi:hypothetical protein